MTIVPSGAPPRPSTIETASDHRMAMAFALAGLAADGVKIDDARCVAKSNPSFWDQLERLRGSGESELERDPGTPAL